MAKKSVRCDIDTRLREANVLPPPDPCLGDGPRIVIRPHRDGWANVLSETRAGLLRYIIDIRMTSSFSRPFAVCDYWFETPWDNPGFYWLPDPGRDHRYKLPDCASEYAREEVLNHRNLVLYPGMTIAGIFLGVSTTPLPRKFRNNAPFKFVLEDDFENRFSGKIPMLVDRSERMDSPEARAGRRRTAPREAAPLSLQDSAVSAKAPTSALKSSGDKKRVHKS